MTREEMKNYMVTNYGFESPFTIMVFRMDEEGYDDDLMAWIVETADEAAKQ